MALSGEGSTSCFRALCLLPKAGEGTQTLKETFSLEGPTLYVDLIFVRCAGEGVPSPATPPRSQERAKGLEPSTFSLEG